MKGVSRMLGKQAAAVRNGFFATVRRAGFKLLQIEGLAGELINDVQLMQHIGFASHIPMDADVVVVPVGGKSNKSVVIATAGGAIRVDVNAGETMVYDQYGHSVLLHSTGITIKGNVEIDGALHVKQRIETDSTINAVGSISSAAHVRDMTGSMALIRITYNTHQHPVNLSTALALPTPNVMG